MVGTSAAIRIKYSRKIPESGSEPVYKPDPDLRKPRIQARNPDQNILGFKSNKKGSFFIVLWTKFAFWRLIRAVRSQMVSVFF